MEFSKNSSKVREMFASIAGRYEVTNNVLSFGIHHLWRMKLAKTLLGGSEILDLATGTGSMIPYVNKKFSKITAADFCKEMLENAKPYPRTTYILADALSLPFGAERFDAVTVGFGVRNFSDLEVGLKEIFRVLKTGGQLVILEFGKPKSSVVNKCFSLYSKHFLTNVGYLMTGNKEAYEYLPETSAAFPSGEEFLTILKQIGFKNCSFISLSAGVAYLYDCKK
jgi:demethylmenaquinone methyltransferase / 2-methoxy-6-polyprenyl-1,4-benzoquinol methylase